MYIIAKFNVQTQNLPNGIKSDLDQNSRQLMNSISREIKGGDLFKNSHFPKHFDQHVFLAMAKPKLSLRCIYRDNKT